MRMKAIPRPKVKTAYDLMAAVNREILKEPARLDMGGWIKALNEPHLKNILGIRRMPACGTIGCFAGWAALLKDGPVATGNLRRERPSTGVPERVLELLSGPALLSTVGSSTMLFSDRFLGPRHGLRHRLFDAFVATDVYDKGGRLLKPGTQIYARAIVRRFKAILDEFETELKARVL